MWLFWERKEAGKRRDTQNMFQLREPDRRMSISLPNSAVRFESILSFPVSGWIGPGSGCRCHQPFTPWMSCTDSQLCFIVAKRKQILWVTFGAESGNSLSPLIPYHTDVPGQPQLLDVDCSPTVWWGCISLPIPSRGLWAEQQSADGELGHRREFTVFDEMYQLWMFLAALLTWRCSLEPPTSIWRPRPTPTHQVEKRHSPQTLPAGVSAFSSACSTFLTSDINCVVCQIILPRVLGHCCPVCVPRS